MIVRVHFVRACVRVRVCVPPHTIEVCFVCSSSSPGRLACCKHNQTWSNQHKKGPGEMSGIAVEGGGGQISPPLSNDRSASAGVK